MADSTNTNQGRGWHGDPEGHAKAGKQGGDTMAEKHKNDNYYEEIGEKGGEASPTKFQKGDERTKKLASEGGQASHGGGRGSEAA